MPPAIGPTISGVILNYLSWRWMFLLVLPISVGALALGGLMSDAGLLSAAEYEELTKSAG